MNILKPKEYVRFASGKYSGCLLTCEIMSFGGWRWFKSDLQIEASKPPEDVMQLVYQWQNTQYAGLSLAEFLRPLMEE